MRNTKNSMEVQGTGTAQQLQEQFNLATQKLFQNFDFQDIKPSVDNLLLGWIDSDYFELHNAPKRSAILDFFNRSLIFLQKVDLGNYRAEKKEIPFYLFAEMLQSKFGHNSKEIKKYFKFTMRYFLESELSDDNSTRGSVIYTIEILQKYFKKIYSLCEPQKPKKVRLVYQKA